MKKIIISSLFLLVFLIGTSPASAAGKTDPYGWTEDECNNAKGFWYEYGQGQVMCIAKPPEIAEFNVSFGELEQAIKEGKGANLIAQYITALYKFGVGAAAVLAVVMIMVGGFIWLTAGGNQERVTAAKGYITGALIGLVVALGSYSVLKVVNPSLVFFTPLKIPMVKKAYFGDFCPLEVEEGMTVYEKGEEGKNEEGEDKALSKGTKLKCPTESNPGKYLVSSAGGTKECLGVNCGGSKFCLPNGEVDDNNNLIFRCLDAEKACEKFDEDLDKRLGLPEGQGICDKVNKPISEHPDPQKIPPSQKGQCIWINRAWYSPREDGCFWCKETDYQGMIEHLAEGNFDTEKLCNDTWHDLHSLQEFLSGIWPFDDGHQACLRRWCNEH